MKKGFTLIEIIVALGIFAIVAVVALAALVKIVDANKKAQTTQDAVIGLSFALEAMSRELRTASNIHCEASSDGNFSNVTTFNAQSCVGFSGHNQLIVFRSTNVDYSSSPSCKLIYGYLFSTNPDGTFNLSKAEQDPGTNCAIGFTPSSFYPITPGSVSLTGYQMLVTPTLYSLPFTPPNTYPLVFLMLSGYSGTRDRVKTYFTVQTAISQRTL